MTGIVKTISIQIKKELGQIVSVRFF